MKSENKDGYKSWSIDVNCGHKNLKQNNQNLGTLTWVEATVQFVLGSTLGRWHLEDRDRNQSPLEKHEWKEDHPTAMQLDTFWVTALLDESVRPFAGPLCSAVS